MKRTVEVYGDVEGSRLPDDRPGLVCGLEDGLYRIHLSEANDASLRTLLVRCIEKATELKSSARSVERVVPPASGSVMRAWAQPR